MDTCGTGVFTRLPSRDVTVSDKAAIDKLAKVTGRAVLAAASTDQMALEGYMGHGVFTYAFLEGFSNTTSDRNGLITVTSLADYIEYRVPQITVEKWRYEQFPLSLMRGQSFSIARKQDQAR